VPGGEPGLDGDDPDRGLSAASAPPILRCRDCDQYWVRHGALLDPI